ncbi:MAG TPA: hypothetical protein VJ999_02755 [Candidatus Sulfotelmatobacter sp.]|nr:hypothetical protein [Candidatus Sulfotelmatobacter sp.]
MEILTPKTTRRSTRIRVEIPVTVTSLDRMRPFSGQCVLLVVSAQGCGIQSPQPLQTETPIMIAGIPGGASVTARVANCVPLGSDGKSFLIGAALYNHGNVWGIVNPPEDWKFTAQSAPAGPPKGQAEPAPQLNVNRKSWPYNLFEEGAESHPGRK